MNELPGRQEDRESRIEKYTQYAEREEPIQFESRDDENLTINKKYKLNTKLKKTVDELRPIDVFDED